MNVVLPIVFCLIAPLSSFWSPFAQDAVPDTDLIEVLSVSGITGVSATETSATETFATETDVEKRVREILNDANTRYWKNRARMKTLPEDRWTPQQAGWVDASGRPLVANWPWWAW
jgi:hypothetical protein